MKLTVSKRSSDKKSELTTIRVNGDIPAVLYAKEKKNENIVISGPEFAAAMRKMEQGHLPTTVFELDGKKALVKEVQYHKTSYRIVHLDFQLLNDKEEVDVNVPINYVGVADCVGIKLGGFLRQVRRHVRVRCLPKDMPKCFEVDVRDMNIGQVRKAKDIGMGEKMRSLFPLNEVVVTIAKR